MIIQQNTSPATIIGAEVIKSGVSQKDISKILDMFGGSLYKNIYSWIPELVQNARDSHRRIGSTEKVKLGFGINESGEYVYIKDWGEGMSKDIVVNVLSQYGASTKDDNNDDIGGKGLGFFSNSAFTNKTWIITSFDGVEYTYLCNKNDNNSFTLLQEISTNKPNGTEVRIYFNDIIEKSYFYKKDIIFNAKNLITYFDCVEIDHYDGFKNPIYKHELYSYCEDFKGDDYVHINYEGYYYKFPIKETGIDPLRSPLAIPFNVEELQTTPSREDLILNAKSIDLIKFKYNKLIEHLKETAPIEFYDVKKYLNVRSNQNYLLIENTNCFVNYHQLGLYDKIVFKPLESLGIKVIIPNCINYYKLSDKKKLTFSGTDLNWNSIKTLFIKDQVNVFSKNNVRNYFDNKINNYCFADKMYLYNWKLFLSLNKYPKSEWRTRINTYVNWLKSEIEVLKLSEVPNSDKFKTFAATIKKQRAISVKREKVLYRATWTERGTRKVKFESVDWYDYKKENTVTVTKTTSKKDIEIIYSICDNLGFDLFLGKAENLTILSSNRVIDFYCSCLISELKDKNNDRYSLISLVESSINTSLNCLSKHEVDRKNISQEISINSINQYLSLLNKQNWANKVLIQDTEKAIEFYNKFIEDTPCLQDLLELSKSFIVYEFGYGTKKQAVLNLYNVIKNTNLN